MTSHATDIPLSFLQAKDAVAGVETDAFCSAGFGMVMRRRAKSSFCGITSRSSVICTGLSGKIAVAEDLHQQAWLAVMEHIDKFDASVASGGFKAWLFRIATNKANDLWRSAKRQRSAYHGAMLIAENEAPQSGERAEVTEEAAKLRDAIAKLPEQQRQVLLLRYYSGLKFVEIAETLGLPAEHRFRPHAQGDAEAEGDDGMNSLLHELQNNEAILLMYLANELPPQDREEVEHMLDRDANLRLELAKIQEGYSGYHQTMRRWMTPCRRCRRSRRRGRLAKASAPALSIPSQSTITKSVAGGFTGSSTRSRRRRRWRLGCSCGGIRRRTKI